MHAYQRHFIDLMLHHDVLRFGQFTLKSGRQSPYFFNLGAIASGKGLQQLGQAYAACLTASSLDIDMLFGPAYKGIPLASATAIALAAEHQRDLPFSYNRKEPKKHGEGGQLVGAPLTGRVLIIDDVMTAGTAVRQSIDIIKENGATPAGVLVALDRQERGQNQQSATQEISAQYDLPVMAIAGLEQIMQYVADTPELAPYHSELATYQAQFGVA